VGTTTSPESSAAVWDSLTVSNTGASATGHLYVAQNPENYTYDVDGNLLSDGRWNYTWDGENRLLSMTSLSGAPTGSKLELNFIMFGWGAAFDDVPVNQNNDGTFYDLRIRLSLRGLDSPDSILRKVGFAKLGAGDRAMGADLAAPGGCPSDVGDIYPAVITEWHWNGLKN
jgi:hypothetical protein